MFIDIFLFCFLRGFWCCVPGHFGFVVGGFCFVFLGILLLCSRGILLLCSRGILFLCSLGYFVVVFPGEFLFMCSWRVGFWILFESFCFHLCSADIKAMYVY